MRFTGRFESRNDFGGWRITRANGGFDLLVFLLLTREWYIVSAGLEIAAEQHL
jgi:hypothetical protein